jgi:hypothetical protein
MLKNDEAIAGMPKTFRAFSIHPHQRAERHHRMKGYCICELDRQLNLAGVAGKTRARNAPAMAR